MRQSDLARALGTRFQRISEWENGKFTPELGQCFDIARVLGRPVEEVFCGEYEASADRLGSLGGQTPDAADSGTS